MRDWMVERCETSERSITSCTECAQSCAMPVWRHAITSEWSLKMVSACFATERAETWITHGINSPAMRYRFGIMSSKPWLAVNVQLSAPPVSAPCTAPAAPASDCIVLTSTTWPKQFTRPRERHASMCSPIEVAGEMG